MPLNSLKYSLKNQFTSIANSGVRASFDKLREIVSDAFDNASSSKNGEIDGAGMFGVKTPIFQFPLNAVADPTNPNGNHGHFILFYIKPTKTFSKCLRPMTELYVCLINSILVFKGFLSFNPYNIL